jgi:hypothetical protein
VSAFALGATDVDTCPKVMRIELAQSMLQALAEYEHMHCHFLVTGDESWMLHTYDHRTRWLVSWDDVDEIQRLSHFHQKIMFTILFIGTAECKMAILPEGQKMNSTYFIERVPRPLTEICYTQGRGYMKGYSCCILTMRRFTTLKEFKKAWQILNSEEWSIRFIVRI